MITSRYLRNLGAVTICTIEGADGDVGEYGGDEALVRQ